MLTFTNRQRNPYFHKSRQYYTFMNVLENNLRCRSLEYCYDNLVTIKVYAQQGEGLWYIDDGIS